MRTLEDRLSEERHRAFVGRTREIETFLRARAGSQPSLLFFSGEAGVGKSTLLREFRRICEADASRVSSLDAARLGQKGFASRGSVERRILGALSGDARGESQRPVLLVDDYESLGPEHTWVLEELFPRLPMRTLIVAASRRATPIGLALDTGWAAITQSERLLPFSDADAREFFDRRSVPLESRAAAFELSGGHPLSLSLAADALEHGPLTEHRVHDIQRRVLDALGLEARTRGERLVLGLGSIARAVTLELIEYVLSALGDTTAEDPQHLFAWLAGLSLVEPRRIGLFLHPLIRRSLSARFKRERRLEYEALHLAVREFYVEKLALGVDGARWLKDLIYTQSPTPAERLLGSPDEDEAGVEPARPGDHAAILELVHELEGAESAKIAATWLASHPHTFTVVRHARVESVLQALMLDAKTVDSLSTADPACASVRDFLERNPLRPDEQAIVFRFRLDRTAQGSPSPRMTPMIAREIQLLLSAVRPAFSFNVHRELGDWKVILDRAGVPYRHCGRFTTSEGSYSVVVYSWRERSLRELLLSAGKDGAEMRRHKPAELGSSAPGSSEDLQIKVRKRVEELGRRARLTTRELEILELLCLGKSAIEIARTLGIRPRTVKFHQENVLKKTGMASRLELFKVLL